VEHHEQHAPHHVWSGHLLRMARPSSDATGILFQLSAVAVEATRLVLIQAQALPSISLGQSRSSAFKGP